MRAISKGTWDIYDGWRVIQERDGSNNPLVSYTRGNDLSGSMGGAGGIGGLLARSDGYSSGNFTTHNYYFSDGNGNVTYMLNSSQSMVASYRYDPFGNTISSSGTLASANVYRFSSKEIHANSGMYYYGYRFYDPNLQRWTNTDPLQEEGGFNLYGFVLNDPVLRIDPSGDNPGLALWLLVLFVEYEIHEQMLEDPEPIFGAEPDPEPAQPNDPLPPGTTFPLVYPFPGFDPTPLPSWFPHCDKSNGPGAGGPNVRPPATPHDEGPTLEAPQAPPNVVPPGAQRPNPPAPPVRPPRTPPRQTWPFRGGPSRGGPGEGGID